MTQSATLFDILIDQSYPTDRAQGCRAYRSYFEDRYRLAVLIRDQISLSIIVGLLLVGSIFYIIFTHTKIEIFLILTIISAIFFILSIQLIDNIFIYTMSNSHFVNFLNKIYKGKILVSDDICLNLINSYYDGDLRTFKSDNTTINYRVYGISFSDLAFSDELHHRNILSFPKIYEGDEIFALRSPALALNNGNQSDIMPLNDQTYAIKKQARPAIEKFPACLSSDEFTQLQTKITEKYGDPEKARLIIIGLGILRENLTTQRGSRASALRKIDQWQKNECGGNVRALSASTWAQIIDDDYPAITQLITRLA